MTLVTGGELFTGNTALVTAAVMEGKTSKADLIKNWVSSYAGNFVGSLLLAFLAFKSGTLGAAPASKYSRPISLLLCHLRRRLIFLCFM